MPTSKLPSFFQKTPQVTTYSKLCTLGKWGVNSCFPEASLPIALSLSIYLLDFQIEPQAALFLNLYRWKYYMSPTFLPLTSPSPPSCLPRMIYSCQQIFNNNPPHTFLLQNAVWEFSIWKFYFIPSHHMALHYLTNPVILIFSDQLGGNLSGLLFLVYCNATQKRQFTIIMCPWNYLPWKYVPTFLDKPCFN